MLHPSRVVTHCLQKEDINKMDQPEQPHRAPVGRIGAYNNNMDHPQHNLHELCQASLDQWASIPLERLHFQVASMPCWLAAIIRITGGNTRY